jgi:hypothetical protein
VRAIVLPDYGPPSALKRRFPLAEAGAAHALAESHADGKVLLLA